MQDKVFIEDEESFDKVFITKIVQQAV